MAHILQRAGDNALTEGAGPLEEIAFWANRTKDLSGISDQLKSPHVKRIVDVLGNAKSSYLAPFMTLSQMIHRGSVEANDNLKFLNTLRERQRVF